MPWQSSLAGLSQIPKSQGVTRATIEALETMSKETGFRGTEVADRVRVPFIVAPGLDPLTLHIRVLTVHILDRLYLLWAL